MPHIKLKQPPEDRKRWVDTGGPDPDAEAAAAMGLPCPPEPGDFVN